MTTADSLIILVDRTTWFVPGYTTGLGDNTVLGGPIEIVVKCIIPCIGRTLRCAEIVEVCLGEGDDFTANFSIDKEIEGEVFVIEGVGPTEGVLGIHVAEVFVGLSIEFEWSSGLRVDNDFSGYFVSHKVDGIEVAIRTAFFEFVFRPLRLPISISWIYFCPFCLRATVRILLSL